MAAQIMCWAQQLPLPMPEERQMQQGGSAEITHKESPMTRRQGEFEVATAYGHLLRAFANSKDLQAGSLIHDYIVAKGLEENRYIGDHLVHMYVKCGCFADAARVFEKMPSRGLLSWNRMISGNVEQKNFKEAVSVFRRMQLEGVEPNRITFVTVLTACVGPAYLQAGKVIHAQIIEFGLESCMLVSTGLINMYGNCGSLQNAIRVFKKMQKRDVASWTSMIAAYAQQGHSKEAIRVYQKMLLDGIMPNEVTFAALLNAVADARDLVEGRRIHRHTIEKQLQSHVIVATALMSMFGKCGDVKNARRVFRRMHDRDIVAWNALLTVHIDNGQFYNALQLFRRMEKDGVTPNRATLLAALGACVKPSDLEDGKRIHVSAINHGLESSVAVANALMNMYSKCGSLRDAEWMFGRMEKRNVVSWSTLIAAYVQHDRCEEALDLFRRMQLEGIEPDKVTCVTVVTACASLELLEEGRLIHSRIVQSGFESNIVRKVLLNMYSKCKSLDDACRVFNQIRQPDVESWNAIIAAYFECDHRDEALRLFQKMQLEGVKPNKATFVNSLAACSSLEDVEGIYACTVETELDSDMGVGNALLTMYRQCGRPEDGEKVFRKMHLRDEVSWRSMFALYGQHGCCREALGLFQHMQLDGLKPSKATFVILLSACMGLGRLADAKLIHACIMECGYEADVVVSTCLLNMYSKCGSLEDASTVFNIMHHVSVALWNAMIAAYSENGYSGNGFLLFQRMLREGMMPNRTTFVNVLNACGVRGALAEGKLVHSEIVEIGLELDVAVGTALIDMYGKCGCVDAAQGIFQRMQQRTVATWSCMIESYVVNGQEEAACQLLRRLQLEGLTHEIRVELLELFVVDSADATSQAS